MRNPHLDDDFRELGLPSGASLEQVRTSYRELALLWHPDRRDDGQERASRSHHRMTRINLAYERLRKALERRGDSKTDAERTENRPPQRQRPDSKQASGRRQHSQETRTNTLGMRFVSAEGTSVLFSIWLTRIEDYRAYAQSVNGVGELWQNPGFAQTASHPVVNVSWDDANRFCTWLTEKERSEGKLPINARYRLPTDAEWSWAVGIGHRERTGTPREKGKRLKSEYPWGTAWPPPKDAGNYAPSLGTDSFEFTSPVASFPPNALGLFDLGGNVWEWCEDFVDGAPPQKASDGSTAVRVLRGGSWNFSSGAHLLSSYRNGAAQGARSGAIGFRIVLSLG